MIKQKRKINIIVLIVMLMLLILALISCKPTEIIKETKTVKINSEEDFKNLLVKNTGELYSLYTYEINADLDFTNEIWEPIAKGDNEFFMGTINGNNHTIKYKIEKEAEKTDQGFVDVENFNGSDYYSLIAKAKNLKITNLKVEADISYEAQTNISYASSLIGYAVDSVVISSVSVSGNILSKMPDLAEHKNDLEDKPLKRLDVYEGHTTQYIGGIVGYGFDNISFINSESNVNIKAEKSNNGFAKNIFVGGLVGYIRSSILTNGANKNIVKHDDYCGQIDITGENVYVGGLAGDAENLNTSQFILKNSDIKVYFMDKLKLGGIAGQAMKSEITESMITENVNLEVNKITATGEDSATITNNNTLEAASIGGAVGYLKDDSSVKDCSIELNIIVTQGKKYYIGGIVGVLFDSSIQDCISSGDLMISKTTSLKDYEFNFLGAEYESKEVLNRVLNSAGIVGKVGYKASFNNIATKFFAFRNSSAEKHDDIKNFSIDEKVRKDDPDLKNYLYSKGYLPYDEIIEKIVFQEQSASQKKDKIVSCSVFFKISENEVTYSADSAVYEKVKENKDAREITDKVEPLVFGKTLEKVDADSKFDNLKEKIESKIITK